MAANHVLYHNIIYSKHVVWWFLLNKMDKKDLFFYKYNFLNVHEINLPHLCRQE